MKPLTIAHFSQDFREGKPQLGGYTRIANTTRDGVHRHVIYTCHFGDREVRTRQEGHVEVHSMGLATTSLSWKNKFFLVRELATRIEAHLREGGIEPDLFFGHSQLFNFDLMLRLKAAFPGRRLLWEANTLWGTGSPESMVQKLVVWNSRRRMARCLQGADRVVVQTRRSREVLHEAYGYPRERMDVVTNALDFKELVKDRPPKEYQAATVPRTMLCFGLFDAMNGIGFLTERLPEIDPERFRVEFMGRGALLPRVEAAVGLGECTYHPPVPYQEVLGKILSHDFVVIPRLPSEEADNFIPTKLLEAMGVGMVVLGSDVQGISEVIEDGVNGFLFEAGSPESFRGLLDRVAHQSPEDLARISRAARQTISERYTWEAGHQSLDAIYRQLTEEPEATP